MRKRLNLLLIILLMIFLPKETLGATQVENKVIVENTIWSGEIIVIGTATVERNAILTISPGTIVKFISADGALIVRGTLLANGTYDQKITLTSDENTSLNKWKGIVFSGEKTEDNINKLSNCIIKYANVGVECSEMAAVNIENCTFTKNGLAINFFLLANGIISHSGFIENTYGGIICEQAKLQVNNNYFINNTNFAVNCAKRSEVNIERNLITKSQYGIIFSGFSTIGQIKNNIVQENEFGIFAGHMGKPIISNNTIQGNGYGIYIKQDAVPKIFLNEITKNRIGIFLMESYNLNILSINDNNIYENKEYEAGLEKSSAKYARETIRKTANGDTTINNLPIKDYIMSGLSPLEYIDARRNFWGKELTNEMKEKGDSSNISKILDCYDNPIPAVKEGEEPEEKKYRDNYFLFSEWREKPVEEAGSNIKPSDYPILPVSFPQDKIKE